MTRLLVSVRDRDEARLCIDAGVDLLDLKEPRAGALGAVPTDVCAAIVQQFGARLPVSAALGELLEYQPQATLPRGLSFAKVGLAECETASDWPARWQRFAASLPEGTQPVAVAYADAAMASAPQVLAVIQHTALLGARVLLIDTFGKQHGGILDHLPLDELRKIIRAARAESMKVVLGGSLRLDTIETVMELEPDVIAVRGAACEGARDGMLSSERVYRLVKMLRSQSLRDSSHTREAVHDTSASRVEFG